MSFITEAQILDNKALYLELIRMIKRKGADIPALIEYLENSDFFVAPASTSYHNSCKGGLCAHCLNVYHNLVMLYKNMISSDIPDEVHETLIIVALLHDVSKMNMYKETYKNKKVYSSTGSKSDNGGKFDWVSVPGYEIKPVEERLVLGNHEQNAEYLARCFIPLTIEESSAILHHMGGMSWDSAKDNIGEIYGRYPIALLLYQADMLSTYISEKDH